MTRLETREIGQIEMAKLRSTSIRNIHNRLSRPSLQELANCEQLNYRKYSYLYCLNHIALLGNKKEFKDRLLDLLFLNQNIKYGKSNQDLFSYWQLLNDTALNTSQLDELHKKNIKIFCRTAKKLKDLDVLCLISDYFRASSLYQSCLISQEKECELSLKIHGAKNAKTLSSHHGLMLIKCELGQYRGVADDIGALVEQQKELLGESHEVTLKTMMLRADCLNHLGKTHDAENLQRLTLKILSENFGEFNQLTLEALNSLGVTLLQNGQVEEALEKFEACIERRIRQLSEEAVEVQICRINVANCFLSSGKLAEAIELAKKAGDQIALVLGDTHSTTVLTRLVLANCHLHNEDFKIAKKLFRKYAKLFEQTHGSDHPRSWDNNLNYAIVLNCLDEFDQSLKVTEKVIKNALKTQNYEHPVVRRCLQLAAASSFAKNDYEASARYYELIVQKMADNDECMTEDYCAVVIELADVLIELEKFNDAIELKKDVLRIRTKIFGETHPDTISNLYELGLAYQQAGNPSKAKDYFYQELNACQLVYGAAHEETINSRENIVSLAFKLEDFPQTLEQGKLLADAYKEIISAESDADTCFSLSRLGKTFFECGSLDEAITYLELSNATLEEIVATDHHEVNLDYYRDSLEYLLFLYKESKDTGKAKRLEELIKFIH